MKLIGPTWNGRVTKILIAANLAGIHLEVDEYWPKDAPENIRNEFLKKNPNGKIPVLETEHGYLFESNTILRYIARLSKGAKLYGATPYEEAVVDQHLDWFISAVEPVYLHVVMPLRGMRPYNQELFTKATDSLKEMLKIVEDILKNSKYLVGDNITLADIFLMQLIAFLFKFAFGEKDRKPFPNLVKYFLALSNEKAFASVLGRPALCKNALKPYVSAEEKAASKKKKGAKEETKKEEPKAEPKKEAKKEKEESKKEEKKKEPKKEQPKKEQPKKEAKKAKDEDDDDEPKEKKVANPLDSLPPSSFNLFDFKTLIVNAPDKKEAVKTFLEQFDPAGYSVWFITYDKAEGEGEVVYRTSNLMNGFLQRLENFRKYAFGVHGVYGDEPKLEIRGVWVWRGTEIAPDMKEHPSYEYHQYHKLDMKNEADIKKLEEFWSKMKEDVDVVDGLTVRDVKYFK